MSLRVVVAPDSFKGSLSATRAAAAMAEGWGSRRPQDTVVAMPQADGGEGTLDAIAGASPDARWEDAGEVDGPDGRTTRGRWLRLPGSIGVIELAQASGLPLMQRLDAMGASTRGLGQTIAAAVDAGVDQLVIGLGGSASTDGGAGALSALGLRLLGDDGRLLGDGGGALARLARVDRSSLRAAPAGGLRLLTDVSAPLLGPDGAAAVFAPQKGAGPGEVRALETALTRFAHVLGGDPAVPGSGAAGGTAYGLQTVWGGSIEPGARVIADLTGLSTELQRADVVITGEGSFDRTSMSGKVVGSILREIAGRRPHAVVIAGHVDVDPASVTGSPVRAAALDRIAGSTESAIAWPERWIRAAAADAAGRVSG